MLRITQIANARAASSYHRSSLSKQGEYYKDKVQAFWFGGLSEKLKLGEVNSENFDALVNNKIPGTQERLTAIDTENRRVGWDLTTLPSKSFSILSAFSNQLGELDQALRSSNRQMMEEAERMVLTQANTQKNRYFEQTSNACWAEFHHRIGRGVEYKRQGEKVFAGQPLEHVHNVLISASHSESRDKILAIDPFHIFKSAPYLESYFETVLANQLLELGYKIERTEDSWEIVGVSHLNDRFSDRTKIIEKTAQEKGITSDKEKSKIGAKTRISKSKAIPESEHFALWKSQLTKEEFEALQKVKTIETNAPKPISISESIDRSLEHFLQRNSTAEKNRVLGHAMKLSYGSGNNPDAFKTELEQRENVLWGEENDLSILTTKELVRSENEMISLATSGKGKFKPLNPNYKIKRDFLVSDQKSAVLGVLSSKTDVFSWEGKAGSGKTTTLREFADALAQVGKPMIPIGQSTQSVEVLREEGFKDASTIASFLINPAQQEQARNGVIVVDESSFMGVPTATEILKVAKEIQSRVLLTGNIRQHSSPAEHGDALRLLQQRGKIETFHMNQNMRQTGEDYKRAVSLIADKKMAPGFHIIDQKMKAIIEIPDRDQRLDKLAESHVNSMLAKRKVLSVTTTNQQKNEMSNLIREKLKAAGELTGHERLIPTLRDLNLSESDKKDPLQYSNGRVIRFWKNQKSIDGKQGFKAGSHYEIQSRSSDEKVQVKDLKTHELLSLKLDQVKYHSVHEKTETPLMVGDHIKPTANLHSRENTRLNNGTPQRVRGFDKRGDILLENGKTLAKDSYHIAQNYASTTFAAQGSTCLDVNVSLSEGALSSLTDQSFYVAITRGRSNLRIFTDSKDQLRKSILRSGERRSADSVAKEHARRTEEHKRINHHQSMNKDIKEYAASRQRQKEAQRDISGRAQYDR